MIRYIDNTIKMLAEETAWPGFYRVLCWFSAAVIMALAIAWHKCVPMQYPIP